MKRIGEILMEQGALEARALELALDKQKKENGKMLGEILIEMGCVTEEDIVAALSTQFNMPYLPVRNFTPDESLRKVIPKVMAEKYRLLPLDKIGNLLTVVMADPTNQEVITELETKTNCKIQLFVATPSEILEAIRLFYPSEDKRVAGTDAVPQVNSTEKLTPTKTK